MVVKTPVGRAVALLVLIPLGGCLGNPHVNLTAADSMELLATSLQGTIEEYHREVDAFDRQRRDAVIEAFVARVRAGGQDEAAMAGHVAAFSAALDRIEADKSVAWNRQAAAAENLQTLAEIADSLRRQAVESLAMQDEARRYLTELITRASAPSKQGEAHDAKP